MKYKSSTPTTTSFFRMSIGYSPKQTKVFWFLSLLLSMLFLSTLSAEAASNHYIRAGASGSATGNDWTNAYTSLPSSLTRGDTYYLADGSYNSYYTLDTAVSGSLYIYIKKATVSNHGTSTGWSDSYGVGQAVFENFRVNSTNGGYLEFDGQQAYGIKFHSNDVDGGVAFALYSGSIPNVHLRYCEIAGVGGSGDYYHNYNTFGLWNGLTTTNTDGFIMSHCSAHGIIDLIHWSSWASGNNALFEYNDLYDNRTSSTIHENIFYASGTANNIIFRYNKIHNYAVEGIFFTGNDGSHMTNWYIYGNVFYDGVYAARALSFRGDYNYGAVYFYNNTCVDLPIGCVENSSGVLGDGNGTSGGAIRNNIGYNARFANGNIPSSNNSSVSSSAFVSYSGKNFHLAAATTSGTILSSPSNAAATTAGTTFSSTFNVDSDGVTRGTDGVWDLGAYEYVSGGVAGIKQSVAPSNLRIQ